MRFGWNWLWNLLLRRVRRRGPVWGRAYEPLEPRLCLSAWDVALIDGALDRADLIARAANAGTRVIVYDSSTESAAQVLHRVTDLAESSGWRVASVSIFSHGGAGTFALGSDRIAAATLDQTADAWQALGRAMVPGGDIYITGCSVASEFAGEKLITDLAELTGADVFGSTDTTGRGGDWLLEAASPGAGAARADLGRLFNQDALAAYASSLALPAAWASQDIGVTGAAGTADFAGGTFSVDGAGSDIYGNNDKFHFAHMSLDGDGMVIARVITQENTDAWAKSGVMIRESLANGSKHAMAMVTPGNGVRMQYRTNSPTSDISGGAGTAAVWLRMARSGNTFTASRSADGVTWTQIGQATINMGSTVYAGLAVSSHVTGTLNTTTFDNVTVLQAPRLVVAQGAANQINLTWQDTSFGESSYAIERSANGHKTGGSSDYIGDWAQVGTAAADATSWSDTGLPAGVSYGYRLRALSGSSLSLYNTDEPRSNRAGTVTTHRIDQWIEAYRYQTQSGDVDNYVQALANTADGRWIRFSNVNFDSATPAAFSARLATGLAGGRIEVHLDSTSGTKIADLSATSTGDWVTYTEQTVALLSTPTGTHDVYVTFHETGGIGPGNISHIGFMSGAPTAPSGLTATAVSSSQINLVWTDSSNNETGFKIERSLNPGNDWVQIATVGAGVTSYSNTGLAAGTRYYYRVRAYNASGNSRYAGEAIVDVYATTTYPAGVPLVEVNFGEGSGGFAANTGWTGGALALSSDLPIWSTNRPTVGGSHAVDFGTTVGDYAVESADPLIALEGLTRFTIVGWLNNRSTTTGTGGNRVVSWINNGGAGVDLAYRSDGSLSLGIDEWNNSGGVASNTAKVTTDAAAGAGNWVFFAVTYDSTLGSNQAKFYFGTQAVTASLDRQATYSRGAINTGVAELAIGHLNSSSDRVGNTDRMFKGLIDGVQIYNGALSLAEVQSVQGGSVPSAPILSSSAASATQTDLSWTNVANENGYIIERGNDLDEWFQIGSTAADVTTFSDASFASGITYYYRVRAFNTAGSSPYSNTSNIADAAPVLVAGAASPAFTEGDAATPIDGGLTISDADDINLMSATVQITGNYANGQDVLGFVDTANITGSWNAATGTLALSGTDSVAAYQAALRSVTYENTSQSPGTANRTIAFTAHDGTNGGAAVTTTVTVSSVNDAPVNSVPGAQTTGQDNTLVFSSGNGNLISISDLDAGSNAVQVTLTATNGTVTLSQTTGLTFTTGDGTADPTLVFTGTVAAVNSALSGMSFTPALAYVGPASLQIATSDQGNTGSGGAQGDTDTVSISVIAAPAAPSGLGGTPISTSRIDLSWTDNSSDEDGFLIERSANGVSGWVQVGSVAAGVNAFSNTGLSSGTTYHYRVRAHIGGVSFSPYTSGYAVPTMGLVTSALVTEGFGYSNGVALPGQTGGTGWSGAWANTGGSGTISSAGMSYSNLSVSGGHLQVDNDNVSRNLSSTYGTSGTTLWLSFLTRRNSGTRWAYVGVNGSLGRIDTGFDTPFKINGANNSGPVAASYGPTAGVTYFLVLRIDFAAGNDTFRMYINPTPGVTEPVTADATKVDLDLGTVTSIMIGAQNNPAIDVDEVRLGTTYASVAPTTGLPAPSGLSATSAGPSSISLSWTDNTTGELGYRIERSPDGATWADVGSAAANATGYTDTGLSSSTTYYYRVRAFDASVSTAYTTSASATTASAPPVLAGIEAPSLNYTENASATAITSALTASDSDDVNLEGAVIAITGNYASGQDVLGFTNQNGITGSWNSGTGTMTLTGTATVAQYQAALRSITYSNSSQSPSTLARIVSFTVNDGSASSNTVSRTIAVTSVSDAPVLASMEGTTLAYVENGVALAITSALTVSDVDDTLIESATIQITGNYASGEDVLSFTDQNGITGTWSAVTGTMSLSGSATLAVYQAALRTVAYRNTSDNPSTLTRTVSFTVSDGMDTSNTLTRNISVTAANDPPVHTVPGAQTTNEDTPLVLSSGNGNQISIADLDAASGSVQVTLGVTNGTLTLSQTTGLTFTTGDGTADATLVFTGTLADANAALNGLSFAPTADSFGAALLTITTSDQGNTGGAAQNDSDAVAITVNGQVPAPWASADVGAPGVAGDAGEGSGTFTVRGGGADIWGTSDQFHFVYQLLTGNGVLIARVASQTITDGWAKAGVMVRESLAANSAYAFTCVTPSNGTEFQYRSATGASAGRFDGSTSAAPRWVKIVRAGNELVSYESANGSSWTQIGRTTIAMGATIYAGLAVTSHNNATTSTASFDNVSFSNPAAASPVNNLPGAQTTNEDTLLVFSAGNGSQVSITETDGWVELTLSVSNGTLTLGQTSGLVFTSGDGSADAAMTFSGTVADANAALSSISFAPTANYFGAASLQLVTSDGAASDTDSVGITVTAVNDAPVLAGMEGTTLSYVENGVALAITSALTVSDVDDTLIEGATIQITGNYASGQDVLSFTNQNGITGTWSAVTGTMSLSGSATLAQYQAALRSVSYSNSSDNPSTLTRTVSFSVSDGTDASNTLTRNISVTAANDPPVITTTVGSTAYTEDASAVTIDPGLVLADPDSVNITAATVSISAGLVSGDLLSFTDQNGITGSYNAGSGVLTLTGTATVAQYQAALGSIGFASTSNNPGSGTRTISFTASDGAATSVAASRSVTVTPVNDGPTLLTNTVLTVLEGGSGTIGSSHLALTDPDNTAAELVFTVTSLPSSGTLYLSGLALGVNDTFTQDDVNNNGITYTHDGSETASDSFTFTISDGAGGNIGATTFSINITAANDAPVLSGIEAAPLAYLENDPATEITALLDVADADSATLSGATVQITGNYVSGQDVLAFTDTANITGVWDAGTGTLSLSGPASVAEYRAALRSLSYRNTSESPSTLARTVSYTVSDGTLSSNTVTRDIAVTAANDAPTVTTSGGSLAYSEGDGAAVLDAGVTLADADDANLDGATVQITGNYASGQDALAFTDQNGITGTWNAATGTMSLSGSATLAQYQAALRSITYTNTSQAPAPADRTVSVTVTDGSDTSAPATRTITLTSVNDPPTVASPMPDRSASEDAVFSYQFASGTFDDVDGDVLAYSAALSDGSALPAWLNFDPVTRTFSGTPAQAEVGTLSVRVTADDGNGGTVSDTFDLSIGPVNDAPVVTGPATETTAEDTSLVFSAANANAITIGDPDAGLGILEVTLSATDGVLTLGGAAGLTFTTGDGTADSSMTFTGTLIAVNAALSGLTFAPTANFSGVASIAIGVDDQGNTGGGGALTDSHNIAVTVTPVNDLPLVSAGGTLNYTEDDPASVIDAGIALSDADDATLSGATVAITANYAIGEDVLAADTSGTSITASWNAVTGIITLSGVDSLANYQTVLRSIAYANTSQDPSTASRTISVVVNDGTGDSAAASATVSITALNDSPVNAVPGPQTMAEDSTLVFSSGGGNAIAIGDLDAGANDVQVTLTAVNGTISLAQLTGLSFTSGDGAADATMTFTGTVAAINTALDGMSFSSSANYNGAASLTILTSDQGHVGVGGAQTDSDTVAITVMPVNDAPTVAAPIADQSGAEDAAFSYQFASATFDDVDGDALTYAATLSDGSALPAWLSFDGGTRTFSGTPVQGDTGTISVRVTADDGNGGTVSDTFDLTIDPVNDPPVVTTSVSALAYNEDDGPVAVDGGLAIGDVDDVLLEGAVVRIPGNYVAGQDVLAFPDQNGITGVWDGASGTLTLSGTASVAQYQAALRTITYANTSQSPSTALRTVSFTVSDGDADSAAATRDITVADVNDAPTVVTPAAAGDDPLAGVSTMLSALGGDVDDGEAGLTYTWSVTAKPAGAPDPAFTINGSNAAKNAIVSFSRAGSYTFSVTISDGSLTAMSSVTMVVSQALTSVVVTPGTAVLPHRAGQAFSAIGLDQLGQAMAVQPAFTWSIDTGGIGQISPAGDYTAPQTGVGSATIRATVGGTSGTAVVTVTNAAPVASGDTYSTDEDASLAVSPAQGLLSNDAGDSDADPVTLELTTVPQLGSVSINPDGRFVYVPLPNASGTDTFTYRLDDGTTDGAAVTVSIIVRQVNDAPTGVPDGYIALYSQQLNGNVLANDSDIDGDPLSVALVAAASHGQILLMADGTFTYLADREFIGSDSFSYALDDGLLPGGVIVVSIMVMPNTDLPPAPSSVTEPEPQADLATDPIDLGTDPGAIEGGGGSSPGTGSASSPSNQTPSSGTGQTGSSPQPASSGGEAPAVAPTASRSSLSAAAQDRVLTRAHETSQADEQGDAEAEATRTNLVTALGALIPSAWQTSQWGGERIGGAILQEGPAGAVARPAMGSMIDLGLLASREFNTLTYANSPLNRQLDSIARQLGTETSAMRLTVGSASVLTAFGSFGYLIWMARSGTFLASLLSSLPIWGWFDPLPILERGVGVAGWSPKKKKDATADDDEKRVEKLMGYHGTSD